MVQVTARQSPHQSIGRSLRKLAMTN